MSNDLMQPRASDRRFAASVEEGHPDCLCSRCGERIGEDVVAIRMWPPDGAYELRYHPTCVGMESDTDDLADFLEERGVWP